MGFEIAQLLRVPQQTLHKKGVLDARQHEVLHHLLACRTEELGGALHLCNACGQFLPVYRSCRDRHCPKCSALDAARWERARLAAGLPVPYFHVVLTVPGRLRPLFRDNKRVLYDRLLSLASRVTLALAEERLGGARSGLISVLHTWNRKVRYHVHVHLLVLSGGLTGDGRWVERRRDSLLPRDVLAQRFRDALLRTLGGLLDAADLETRDLAIRETLDALAREKWIAYAKKTLSGADQAIAYLARYTSKVALSNDRILDYQAGVVTLATKNGETDKQEVLELDLNFLSHVLPKRFVRIRHYGLLSPRNLPTLLPRARAAIEKAQGTRMEPALDAKLSWQDLMLDLTGVDPRKCSCGATRLVYEMRKGETVDQALARLAPSLPRPARPPTPAVSAAGGAR